LLFDASWYADPWPAVDAALTRGARLVGMVHDLLPLEHPEWFREGLELRFGAHLNQLAERAEQLFVPTTVVRSRLLERLSRQGLPSTVNVLAHGGDFCTLMPTAEQIESYKDFYLLRPRRMIRCIWLSVLWNHAKTTLWYSMRSTPCGRKANNHACCLWAMSVGRLTACLSVCKIIRYSTSACFTRPT
jgi:hypothetical protein